MTDETAKKNEQEQNQNVSTLSIDKFLAPAYETVDNQLKLCELDVKRLINTLVATREELDKNPQYALGRVGQIATQILTVLQKMGAIQQVSAELIANVEVEGKRIIEAHNTGLAQSQESKV